jgi:hypothetical protein
MKDTTTDLGYNIMITGLLGDSQTVPFYGYIETTFCGDMYSGFLGEILCGQSVAVADSIPLL